MTAVFFPLGKHLKKSLGGPVSSDTSSRSTATGTSISKHNKLLFKPCQCHCYFFLPQNSYCTNLKYGWFGHFHTSISFSFTLFPAIGT